MNSWTGIFAVIDNYLGSIAPATNMDSAPGPDGIPPSIV